MADVKKSKLIADQLDCTSIGHVTGTSQSLDSQSRAEERPEGSEDE
jgi:hypothetical protein